MHLERLLEAINFKGVVSGLTHDFYRYPARFSPLVARAAIECFTKPGDTILDPFSGGATSLVEGLALGRHAVGVDISRLAVFLANVKTLLLNQGDLDAVLDWAVDVTPDLSPRKPVERHWEWNDAGYQDNMPWRFRKVAEQAINGADDLPERLRPVARCIVLKTVQTERPHRQAAGVPLPEPLPPELFLPHIARFALGHGVALLRKALHHACQGTWFKRHRLYFCGGNVSESASIVAEQAANSPRSSTRFGGRMSHGSSCSCLPRNERRFRRRGRICRRTAFPAQKARRRFCRPRLCNWLGIAGACAPPAKSPGRRRRLRGTTGDASANLVSALAERPQTFRPLLLAHDSQGGGPVLRGAAGGVGMIASPCHPKIRPEHLRRLAVVYVRQSSAHQVRGNRESSARQYGLAERAQTLGWPAKSVQTIDEDQGRSGAGAEHREGFKKLLAEIGAGQVGIVLALEASRLARSSVDWHRLVEICVITQTLLADESAVYDPRDPNDRLLLGVKGTISEAELFTLQSRLQQGRWNKARRGELARPLPTGYLRTDAGEVVKHPDRQVQARLDYVFRLFARRKVARRVVRQLLQEKLQVPVTVSGGPRHGEVHWRAPDVRYLTRLLHNPTYAGAYVFGQSTSDPFRRSAKTGRAKVRGRPAEEWSICLRDVYPAFITWEQFPQNQETLRANGYRPASAGAPRKGRALLQGIVFCGCCGARMHVLHFARKDKRPPWYCCDAAYRDQGGDACQYLSAREIDEAVTKLFLSALSPAKIDIALQALEEMEAQRAEGRKQWELQRQRADYEVELARRRYEAADPENRLVAADLEARWEEALRQRQQCERDQEAFERCQVAPLLEADRQQIKVLATDLERVWQADSTAMEERKALLRFLVKRVHVDGRTTEKKIHVDVEWHTGAHTRVTVDRPPAGVWAEQTPPGAVDLIRTWLGKLDYARIAAKLNDAGWRTAKGLVYNAAIVGAIVRARGWGRKARKRPSAGQHKTGDCAI